MKLDILAFAAHPDDIELSCSGTLALQQSLGQSIGVIDLTQGELGTRGSVELREEEAAKAPEPPATKAAPVEQATPEMAGEPLAEYVRRTYFGQT